MSSKSSCNYFYRYEIQSIEDISPDTFHRRNSKRIQNCKESFAFEISSEISFFEELSEFISDSKKGEDLVLISPSLLMSCPDLKFTKSNIVIQIKNISELTDTLNFIGNKDYRYLFCPIDKTHLNSFVKFYEKYLNLRCVFWRFYPYDPNIVSSITVSDIASYKSTLQPFPFLEIYNTHAPEHFEFVPEPKKGYYFKFENHIEDSEPILSIIIPTYNNKKFLSNVIFHLFLQKCPLGIFEVIIADDGSDDNSAEIVQEILTAQASKINIRYLYWPKINSRGEQKFFRAGLVRNLAAKEANGRLLMFLDSDMLVPDNFVETCINELDKSDIIQFQRFHINQDLSRFSPSYNKIDLKKDTYIEEENYWSKLFYTNDWNSLPQFWKYTCTYALGIRKNTFIEIGMFKKYYISYGFEDTDLGYECYKRNMRFTLVKTPLKHQTAYDKMQYKNSTKKRLQLLRVTAELFYLQHLNNEIYELLIDFYRFQKPLKSMLRDLTS
jgi:glycosyltransferase involved in cell wall biosynthesis